MNPRNLEPGHKWYCNHSCGFEPSDDGEGPGHCYECGWAETDADRDFNVMLACEEDRIVGLTPAQSQYGFECEHKFVTNIHHGLRCFYCGAKE